MQAGGSLRASKAHLCALIMRNKYKNRTEGRSRRNRTYRKLRRPSNGGVINHLRFQVSSLTLTDSGISTLAPGIDDRRPKLRLQCFPSVSSLEKNVKQNSTDRVQHGCVSASNAAYNEAKRKRRAAKTTPCAENYEHISGWRRREREASSY